MSDDMEWVGPKDLGPLGKRITHVGQVIQPEPVGMDEARGMVVRPDEVLVVVMPGHVDMRQIDAHRERLREVLGNRFIIVMGDDVQLAKVRPDDWGQPAIPR